MALPAARTVAYVENDAAACALLVARMQDGGLDDAPLWTDVRTFDGGPWRGVVDGVIAGIPCQPHSVAGKQLGADDERDLWPVTAALLAAVRPDWFFLENVAGILRYYFERIRPELQRMGFRVAEALVKASEVGAPHGRERLFVLAYREGGGRGERGQPPERGGLSDGSGLALGDADGGGRDGRPRDAGRRSRGRTTAGGAGAELADAGHAERPGRLGAEGGGEGQSCGESAPRGDAVEHASGPRRAAAGAGRLEHAGPQPEARGGSVGDANPARLEGRERPIIGRGDELPAWPPGPADAEGWRRVLAERPDLAPALESAVRGVADGLARGVDLARADRLRVLGNGVVPQQAAYALGLLAGELGVSL